MMIDACAAERRDGVPIVETDCLAPVRFAYNAKGKAVLRL